MFVHEKWSTWGRKKDLLENRELFEATEKERRKRQFKVMFHWNHVVLPEFFMGKSVFLCTVEGSSFIRKDNWRLKGDIFWLRAGKPLKDPCLASCSIGACLRGIAWGLLISLSREAAASAVGEVGEPEEGAVLFGAAPGATVFASVSTAGGNRVRLDE